MAFEIDNLYVFQTDGRVTIAHGLLDMKEWTMSYYFDEENSKKLISLLQEKYTGTLEEMMYEAFVSTWRQILFFHYSAFTDFCEKNDIKYEYAQDLIV